MSEEEMNKLLEEVQELNKIDSAVESSIILKRKHLENELLKKKVNKYKEVIDKATSYVEQHAITVTDGTITTNKHELLEILKEVE